ncbi:hypothetical protein K1719_047069 [Acacia pycnantha]|nr:hypothetical protein K1719_047069 [Acacia pycnantha]
MATGSVLMIPGNCFLSQPPTVLYFHPFMSPPLLSKPINVDGKDLFRFYHTYQECLSFFDHLRPHPIPYANYENPRSLLPEGVQLELHTLPVDARAVADGDTITVYVNALEDPTQISLIPPYVLEAHLRRNEAKATRNYAEADALQQIINNYGFREIKFDNEEVLVRKYRIRLRGTDAPESEMPYDSYGRLFLWEISIAIIIPLFRN